MELYKIIDFSFIDYSYYYKYLKLAINGNPKITQATQAINQDINMEDVLKMMCTIDGAS